MSLTRSKNKAKSNPADARRVKRSKRKTVKYETSSLASTSNVGSASAKSSDFGSLLDVTPSEVGSIESILEDFLKTEETPTMVMPFVVNDKLNLKLRERFPQLRISGKDNGYRHLHPLSAIERVIAEEEALFTLKKLGCTNIVDVGGNVLRHRDKCRAIHSCNPVLGERDYNRRKSYINVSQVLNPELSASAYVVNDDTKRSCVTWCKCDVLTCQCVKPDAYLMVHSGYYFEPKQILKLVDRSEKNTVVMTTHIFDKMLGKFHFNGDYYESQYEIDETNNVTMAVKGNMSCYSHQSNQWLRAHYFEFNGSAMAWDGRIVGDTYVITFVKASVGMKSSFSSKSLPGSTTDHLHFGEVTIDNNDPNYAVYKHKSGCLWSLGSYLWVRAKESAALVPKDLIDVVARHMIGKKRNKDTYQECRAFAIREMRDAKYEMSEHMRTVSIIHVVNIAFVYYLELEMVTLNSMLHENDKKFAWYERLLGFDKIAYCGGCCLDSGEIVDVREEYNANNGKSSLIEGMLTRGYSEKVTWDGVNIRKEVKAMRQGATMDVVSVPYRRDTATKMYQIGLGFVDHIPVVPQSNQSNEVLAVCNRALQETPSPDEGAWNKISSDILEILKYTWSAGKDENIAAWFIIPEPFELWNKSFPPGRRKQHEKALKNYLDVGLKESDFVRSSFVKVETYNKGGICGAEDFDPRLIQGVGHKANVLLGPWMSSFNKFLKQRWNKCSPIVYASGMNAEDIGDWMDLQLAKSNNPLFFWCDYSRYDSTISPQAIQLEQRIYELCGLTSHPDAMKVFKAQRVTKGYTKNGLRYKVKATRKSGDPNTSCGNSLINGITAYYVLTSYGIKIDNISIIVLGDDMLCVIQPHDNKLANDVIYGDLPSYYSEYMSKLGFKAECGISKNLWDAEFCSSLFWPVEDPVKSDGHEIVFGDFTSGIQRHVLGAKPGRLLPKMGFSIRSLTPIQVKGAMIGYEYNYNHVPLIEQYVKFMMSKLQDVSGRRTIDPYKIHTLKSHDMCTETTIFFEARYGIPLSEASKLLASCLKDADRNSLIKYSIMDILMERDN